METPKQQFRARVNVFLGDTASSFPRIFVMEPPIPPPRNPREERGSDSAAWVPHRWIETPWGWNA